tara:strand:+ start:1490 stop:2023 length:534 start_codon:yes stop_codon:yes gene_type:complete
MKKILILLTSITLLTGCAETIALLGPASSLVGGGNVVHSSISSAASYGIKKTTGKSPMQHAIAYAEEKNPNNKKERCTTFAKETESVACYIAKKQISTVKKSTSRKIKNVINLSTSKITKKTKKEKELHLQKKIKTKKETQIKSIESMIVESAISKKQASHLKVAITKSYKNRYLSK